MVIDHIGEFIPGCPLWLRWIGRLSAPLFFICLGTSFAKTHDFKKFLMRLYLCSVAMSSLSLILGELISFEPVQNNIFGTYAAAGILIYLYQYSDSKSKNKIYLFSAFAVWQMFVTAFCVYIMDRSTLLGSVARLVSSASVNVFLCEGGLLWVLTIVLLYACKNRRQTAIRFSGVSLFLFANAVLGLISRLLEHLYIPQYHTFSVLLNRFLFLVAFPDLLGISCAAGDWQTAFSYDFQWIQILALPLMLAYNRQRGKRPHKAFFYVFYPVHIYLLWFIGNVISLH